MFDQLNGDDRWPLGTAKYAGRTVVRWCRYSRFWKAADVAEAHIVCDTEHYEKNMKIIKDNHLTGTFAFM